MGREAVGGALRAPRRRSGEARGAAASPRSANVLARSGRARPRPRSPLRRELDRETLRASLEVPRLRSTLTHTRHRTALDPKGRWRRLPACAPLAPASPMASRRRRRAWPRRASPAPRASSALAPLLLPVPSAATRPAVVRFGPAPTAACPGPPARDAGTATARGRHATPWRLAAPPALLPPHLGLAGAWSRASFIPIWFRGACGCVRGAHDAPATAGDVRT